MGRGVSCCRRCVLRYRDLAGAVLAVLFLIGDMWLIKLLIDAILEGLSGAADRLRRLIAGLPI